MIDLEDELLNKKRNGASNADLRKELTLSNYSDEDIKILLRSIDHRFMNELNTQNVKKEYNVKLLVGGALLIIGVVITIGTFTGILRLGNYWIFAYGPILGGLSMMAATRNGGGYFKRRIGRD